MKLALGTVQFGLDYGISNNEGQTPLVEVKEILALAQQAGIQVLDTAAQYGNSEKILGKSLSANHAFEIVTKTRAFNGNSPDTLRGTFEKSLSLLGVKGVYGLLVHQADDLLSRNGEALYEGLQKLKSEGLVKKTGVSVYTQAQIDAVTDRYEIDLVQAPVNVLDQRLVTSGTLAKLKQKGIEVHARSAFLQGLLVMDKPPAFFEPVSKNLARFQSGATAVGASPLAAALGYVLQLDNVDRVIVGVNTASQLRGIIEAANASISLPWTDFALPETPENERYVNPALWPAKTFKS